MPSSNKLPLDLLLAVFATFIVSTTILSVSTTSWSITAAQQRIGLFQECLSSCCCTPKELNRTITTLAVSSVILLIITTVSSYLFMATPSDTRNRCYSIVPLSSFAAGITMTLTLMHVLSQVQINSYSSLIFIIDTVLIYVFGGLTILHGAMFYFR